MPTAPFDGKPKFYVESLASNDKQWFYELISMYVNPGKTPEPFDVTTKVLTGDNTQLQSWEYEDCQIIDYTAFLDDVLVTRKFTKQFNSEIHDRTILECVGFSVNSGEQEKIYSNLPDAVPKYEDRAILYLYHVFGENMKKFTLLE